MITHGTYGFHAGAWSRVRYDAFVGAFAAQCMSVMEIIDGVERIVYAPETPVLRATEAGYSGA